MKSFHVKKQGTSLFKMNNLKSETQIEKNLKGFSPKPIIFKL